MLVKYVAMALNFHANTILIRFLFRVKARFVAWRGLWDIDPLQKFNGWYL